MSMTHDPLEKAVRAALAERRARWDTDEAWRRLAQRIANAPVSRRTPRQVWAYAVAAAVLIAAAITTVRTLRSSADIAVRTSAGELRTVRLDDGSSVTLGPQSTLRFRATGSERVAELAGMGYFTVRHDARRPFVVRSRDADAQDIGTEFLVQAFAADSQSVVAVVSGSVAILARSGRRSATLRRGQVGRVSRGGAIDVRTEVDVESLVGWTRGQLAFSNEPLAVVARELGRWFGVDILVADSTLARKRITAVYNNPALEPTLDALAATVGARRERSGQRITLFPTSR
jgi:transmembrane sensor